MTRRERRLEATRTRRAAERAAAMARANQPLRSPETRTLRSLIKRATWYLVQTVVALSTILGLAVLVDVIPALSLEIDHSLIDSSDQFKVAFKLTNTGRLVAATDIRPTCQLLDIDRFDGITDASIPAVPRLDSGGDTATIWCFGDGEPADSLRGQYGDTIMRDGAELYVIARYRPLPFLPYHIAKYWRFVAQLNAERRVSWPQQPSAKPVIKLWPEPNPRVTVHIRDGMRSSTP
jgi:hypothetical protein